VPEYSALFTVFNKLFPAFVGQATVVFTLLHVFCYVGMFLFGGRITPSDPMWADRDPPSDLYYLLNFNTYKEGMVTLFMVRASHATGIVEMGEAHLGRRPDQPT
jgi:hypothetical protein